MSALQITVAIDTRKLTIDNADVLKLGDTETPAELRFTSASTRTLLTEGEPIVFTIKEAENFSGSALVRTTAWDRPATADDPYTGTLDLSDAAIVTAIGNEDDLKCVCEVKWEDAGAVRRSQFRPVSIRNSVSRDEDGEGEELSLTFATSAVTFADSEITFASTTYTP